MTIFRKSIFNKWPVLLIIIPLIFTAAFSTQVHNHESVNESVDCPAYFAKLFFSADQVTSNNISPVLQPVIHVNLNIDSAHYFSEFESFLNRAPPLV